MPQISNWLGVFFFASGHTMLTNGYFFMHEQPNSQCSCHIFDLCGRILAVLITQYRWCSSVKQSIFWAPDQVFSTFMHGPVYLIVFLDKIPTLTHSNQQARVVQKMDNAIHWRNHYSVHSRCGLFG